MFDASHMREPPLHPREAKAAIISQFSTISAFEEACGLKEGSTRDVLRGRWRAKTADKVADLLGIETNVMLRRLHLSLKRDNRTGLRPAHRLNAAAR